VHRYEPWSEARAREIIAQHSSIEGAELPIFHALQHAFGYVHQAAVPLVADAVNRTRAEIHGVLTFYHDFRTTPPGRHVLQLCRAEACQSAGGEALAEHAEEKLGLRSGETDPAGRVTLQKVYCLGLCALAPSAMMDGRPVARLDRSRIDALLAEAQR
jgi:formate dehydrogenase subunit gamma